MADLNKTPDALLLHLKWSKTLQKTSDAKSIRIPATADSGICPLKAYDEYMAVRPGARPTDPLVTYKDGNPITIRYLARRWALLVKAAGAAPGSFSLHSLRKGGASFAYNLGGAKLNDVMTQGTW